MSDEHLINRELCEAYRKGCQETLIAKIQGLEYVLLTKIQGLSEQNSAQSIALVALSSKVDLLKLNEVAHLQIKLTELEEQRLKDLKVRREPLGRVQKGAIIVALITSSVAMFGYIVNLLIHFL